MNRSSIFVTTLLVSTLAAASCSDDSDVGAPPTSTEDTGVADATADATIDTAADAATDASADAGDGGPTLEASRLYGIVEKPTEGTSRYFGVSLSGDGASSSLFDESFGAGDIALSTTDGRLFALDQRCSQMPDECAKSAGTVVEVDPNSGAEKTTLELPDGTYNPQDVVYNASADRHYVTAYSSNELHVFDGAGSRLSTTYDLGQFDPNPGADGDPEAFELAVDGDYVLVLLQALEMFTPVSNSRLAVLDTADGSFVDFDASSDGVQALVIPGKNAFGGMATTPAGDIVVGATGAFGETDGGVVRVERSAAGDYTAGSTIVDEETLGGNVTDVVMHGENRGYAAVTTTDRSSSRIKYFDATVSGATSVETVSTVQQAGGGLCLGPARRVVSASDGGETTKGYDAFTATTRYPVTSDGPVGPDAASTGCEMLAAGGSL